MEENINTVTQNWLKEEIKKDWICVDATMGRGNDTYFLAKRCQKVIAFDIQQEALNATQKRCDGFNNIQLHLLSHDKMEEVIKEKVDCILFNLGYLPHFDPSVITKPKTTSNALIASWNLLKKNGILIIVSYIGHPGGQEEHEAVKQFVNTHSRCIKTYTYQTKENAPIAYYLKKES